LTAKKTSAKRNTTVNTHNKTPNVEELFSGLMKGYPASLARAITLIESTQEEDRDSALELIDKCLPIKKTTVRVGITGIPGVGKSTFIEALGAVVTSLGIKVAVLAVDPTSSLSKGSIMGDKTRMPGLANNPLAFIRPSPAGENLGGVARNTREAMLLCEAAGFDLVLIETVGVGQSETAVHSMVDFFLLLQLAGAGDELQGIKRGIVEMADAIVVNKDDGDNQKSVKEARADYERALQLYPAKENGWKPKVLSCSATERSGIPEVWTLIDNYARTARKDGYFSKKRQQQNAYWFEQAVASALNRQFYKNREVRKKLTLLTAQVTNNEISPFRAADMLLQAYGSGT
jgi:LAO/AO transport system kinase